jgi:two-component system response regulator PilR (NtrC family)
MHALSSDEAPLVVVEDPGYEVPRERCAVVLRELDRWPSEAQSRWSAALRQGSERFPHIYTIGSPALAGCVERGEVRRDLWLRTSRFRVDVPCLRERAREIPQLAQAALVELAARHGRRAPALTAGALDSLQRRPWQGNLPELREVLEQAVAFADGVKIGRDAVERAVEAVIAAREDSLANRRAAKQSADRAELVRLLGACRGNVAEVARQLGMTRGAITYRLRKHGLTR